MFINNHYFVSNTAIIVFNGEVHMAMGQSFTMCVCVYVCLFVCVCSCSREVGAGWVWPGGVMEYVCLPVLWSSRYSMTGIPAAAGGYWQIIPVAFISRTSPSNSGWVGWVGTWELHQHMMRKSVSADFRISGPLWVEGLPWLFSRMPNHAELWFVVFLLVWTK